MMICRHHVPAPAEPKSEGEMSEQELDEQSKNVDRWLSAHIIPVRIISPLRPLVLMLTPPSRLTCSCSDPRCRRISSTTGTDVAGRDGCLV
ncbi:hypothetical protein BV22DRAFT_97596 [Leucogyrophana mollusca]|uniref:Uncharacterized protein n=1 Tax=Leucogyrophana mollusca TaxID=85980 RepID=A0ACB8BYR8_9AGAM|nr:hypothetical protein BV22DRAFT_97596 [Leucogyrophana mollusca]